MRRWTVIIAESEFQPRFYVCQYEWKSTSAPIQPDDPRGASLMKSSSKRAAAELWTHPNPGLSNDICRTSVWLRLWLTAGRRINAICSDEEQFLTLGLFSFSLLFSHQHNNIRWRQAGTKRWLNLSVCLAFNRIFCFVILSEASGDQNTTTQAQHIH